jgi:hypothetical protein
MASGGGALQSPAWTYKDTNDYGLGAAIAATQSANQIYQAQIGNLGKWFADAGDTLAIAKAGQEKASADEYAHQRMLNELEGERNFQAGLIDKQIVADKAKASEGALQQKELIKYNNDLAEKRLKNYINEVKALQTASQQAAPLEQAIASSDGNIISNNTDAPAYVASKSIPVNGPQSPHSLSMALGETKEEVPFTIEDVNNFNFDTLPLTDKMSEALKPFENAIYASNYVPVKQDQLAWFSDAMLDNYANELKSQYPDFISKDMSRDEAIAKSSSYGLTPLMHPGNIVNVNGDRMYKDSTGYISASIEMPYIDENTEEYGLKVFDEDFRKSLQNIPLNNGDKTDYADAIRITAKNALKDLKENPGKYGLEKQSNSKNFKFFKVDASDTEALEARFKLIEEKADIIANLVYDERVSNAPVKNPIRVYKELEKMTDDQLAEAYNKTSNKEIRKTIMFLGKQRSKYFLDDVSKTLPKGVPSYPGSITKPINEYKNKTGYIIR